MITSILHAGRLSTSDGPLATAFALILARACGEAAVHLIGGDQPALSLDHFLSSSIGQKDGPVRYTQHRQSNGRGDLLLHLPWSWQALVADDQRPVIEMPASALRKPIAEATDEVRSMMQTGQLMGAQLIVAVGLVPTGTICSRVEPLRPDEKDPEKVVGLDYSVIATSRDLELIRERPSLWEFALEAMQEAGVILAMSPSIAAELQRLAGSEIDRLAEKIRSLDTSQVRTGGILGLSRRANNWTNDDRPLINSVLGIFHGLNHPRILA